MADHESDAEAPLLEEPNAVYVDGCPGCAVDRRKLENPGIPYRHFLHIWFIVLGSSLPISLLFPFLYFMVEDLHIAKREEDIGFYAAFLGKNLPIGASYMLGRALTSTAWGMVADRIGRKPVTVSLTTRFLLGSLNGLLGPIRAYAVEVCRAEHQVIGLSLASTAWAIGLITGPAIGGYLAQETLHKHKFDKKGDEATRSFVVRSVDSEDSVEQDSNSTKKMNLLNNWPLMSSIVLYCIVSFEDAAYTEIFSLWAESDKKYGRLSFSTEDVGQVLVFAGAGILLYQIFIYPHIVKVHGVATAARFAASLSLVLLFTYPHMTYLSRPWLSIVVTIASVLKSICFITVTTCSFILQNISVPWEQRATANGLAMTLMSFSKTIAPSGAGIVFSWAQKRQDAFFFPGDQMVFFVLAIAVFVEFIWTFRPFLAVPEQLSSH